jgi:catechol 2,3-dioxygenase-like lactoylglutathione lyase family enzyme
MLTKPIAISVNRGGQSLTSAEEVAAETGWPVIGVDPRDIVLVDAGTTIVGFGFQILNLQAAIEQGTACVPEEQFEEPVPTEPNTASTLEFAVQSLDAETAKVAKRLNIDAAVAAASKAPTPDGREVVKWTDVNGNLSAYIHADVTGLKGKIGDRYRQILGKKRENPAPLLSVTLQVTDLAASRKFYEGQLGLPVVEASRRQVTLDAGNILLHLHPETSLGLIKKYRQTRMLSDQYSFYTPNIEAEVGNLMGNGVAFPRGIDRSISAGALARFFDPDGYSLWLWQPQGEYVKGMPIDYTKVLKRILGELGAPLPTETYSGPVTTTSVVSSGPRAG